ncbi:MAG: hypothetical protein OXE50_15010, partial [Chloroflexi bacterium]|nr:hypothetical protein [Chloroflexota bacterium]
EKEAKAPAATSSTPSVVTDSRGESVDISGDSDNFASLIASNAAAAAAEAERLGGATTNIYGEAGRGNTPTVVTPTPVVSTSSRDRDDREPFASSLAPATSSAPPARPTVSSGGPGGGHDGSSYSYSAPSDDNDSGGGSSGSDKIVCTAMNEDYGFGSYRQAIWLKYSKDHLTKAHEVGYHAMFLPLLSIRKKWYGKPVYALLKHIARHRTADLRAEMQGKKRDRIGQAWRLILEPLVYMIGRIKGAK